jgi:O-antigen/teichoic acid export membrane protein
VTALARTGPSSWQPSHEPTGPVLAEGPDGQRRRRLLGLGDQVVVSGGNFALLVLLARSMELHAFGVFSILWLAVLFVNSFHMAYIVMPMLTDGVRHRDADRAVYFSALLVHQHLFNLAASVVVLGVGMVVVAVTSGSALALVLLAAVVVGYHTQEYYRRYFFCMQQPGRALIIDLVAYVGRLVPLALVVLDRDAVTVDEAMALVAATYVLAAGLGSALKSLPFVRPGRQAWSVLSRQHWASARYLLPSALLQWLSGNLHLAAASVVLGPVSVSVVRMGQTVVNVGNVYLQAIENAIPVAISAENEQRGRSAALALTLRQLGKSMLVVSVGGCIAIVFAPQVMTLLFGSHARPYAYLIYWMVPTFVLAFVLVFVRALLRAYRATRHWFRGYVLATLLAVTTFYPLQRYWGVSGVLLGMLVTYAVLTAYTGLAALREGRRAHA